MAPQPKRRHTRSRTGKRRGARKLTLSGVSVCANCGKLKISHRVCPSCGKI